MNTVVLGAGAWGTAMSIHLARQGHTVTLVPRRAEHALELASSRENRDYLPGHFLDMSVQVGLERVLGAASPRKQPRPGSCPGWWACRRRWSGASAAGCLMPMKRWRVVSSARCTSRPICWGPLKAWRAR